MRINQKQIGRASFFLVVILILLYFVLAVRGEIQQEKTQNADLGSKFYEVDSKNQIVDQEGNILGILPDGFKLESSKNGSIVIANSGDSIKTVELSGIKNIEVRGKANIKVKDSSYVLNGVENATISFDEDNKVTKARFTSVNGGLYMFGEEGKNLIFNAGAGAIINYDKDARKIEAEKASVNFGNNRIESTKFYATIDDYGNLRSVKLENGGTYRDLKNKISFYSKDKLIIYNDATDIENSKENAISLLANGDQSQYNAKGTVIINNENGINYIGLDKETYTRYRTSDNLFDIKNGNAKIANSKHAVFISNGQIKLEVSSLSSKSAQDFSVGYTDKKGDQFLQIKESAGVATAFRNGKETQLVLANLDNYENVFRQKLQDVSNVDKTNAESKLIELNSRISSGKYTKEDVKQKDFIELALLEDSIKRNSAGDFFLDSSMAMEDYIAQERDPDAKALAQIKLAGLYQANAASLNNKVNEDNKGYYDAAIGLYHEAKKNSAFATSAGMSLATLYEETGDYRKAKDEYLDLIAASKDNKEISQIKTMLALNQIKQGEPRLALIVATDAIARDPGNSGALELKNQLENGILKTVLQKASGEKSQMYRNLDEKLTESFIGHTTNYGTMVMKVLGYYEDVAYTADSVGNQLSDTVVGGTLIEKLKEKGYSLEQIKEISEDARKIADVFNFPIDSQDEQLKSKAAKAAVGVKQSLGVALNNKDVINLLNGGKEMFTFENGEGYIDPKLLSEISVGWRDKVLEQINAKNVLLIAATSARVGLAATGDLTLVGLVGKGISAAASSALGSETAAIIAGSIADSRVAQAIKTTFPVLSNPATGSSQFVLGTGVSLAGQGTINVLAPESAVAQTLVDVVSNMIGPSKVTQVAAKAAETVGVKILEQNVITMEETGQKIAHIVVENGADVEKLASKLSLNNKFLSEGIYETKEGLQIAITTKKVSEVGSTIEGLLSGNKIKSIEPLENVAEEASSVLKEAKLVEVTEQQTEKSIQDLIENSKKISAVVGSSIPYPVAIGNIDDAIEEITKKMLKLELDMNTRPELAEQAAKSLAELEDAKKTLILKREVVQNGESISKSLKNAEKAIEKKDQNNLLLSIKAIKKKSVDLEESVLLGASPGKGFEESLTKIQSWKAKSDELLKTYNEINSQAKKDLLQITESVNPIISEADKAILITEVDAKKVALQESLIKIDQQIKKVGDLPDAMWSLEEAYALRVNLNGKKEELQKELRLINAWEAVGSIKSADSIPFESTVNIGTVDSITNEQGLIKASLYGEASREFANAIADDVLITGKTSISKDEIKSLVIKRAIEQDLPIEEIAEKIRTFDSEYAEVQRSVRGLPYFADQLSELDRIFPGFTNVHLLRDGALIGEADILTKRLKNPTATPDVQMIQVSRETIANSAEGSKKYRSLYDMVSDLYDKAASEMVDPKTGNLLKDRDGFLRDYMSAFERKITEINPDGSPNLEFSQEFYDSVQRTKLQMENAGLFNKDKLRFIDSCCRGTINIYMEAITNKYYPHIKTDSFLMDSTNPYLRSTDRFSIFYPGTARASYYTNPVGTGSKIELIAHKGRWVANTPEEVLLNPSSKSELIRNYMTELIAAQKVLEYAQATTPETLQSIKEVATLRNYLASTNTDLTKVFKSGWLDNQFDQRVVNEVFDLNQVASNGKPLWKKIGQISEAEKKGQGAASPFIFQNIETGEKVAAKTVDPAKEHSIYADAFGQKLLEEAGLPTLGGTLIKYQLDDPELSGKIILSSKYLEQAEKSGSYGSKLPEQFAAKTELSRAYALDALMYNYDRASYNFLYKGDSIYFQDSGAALLSTGTGKFKEFPDKVDMAQLEDVFYEPYTTSPGNQIYGAVIGFKNGKLIIKDPSAVASMINQLNAISDVRLDQITDETFKGITKEQAKQQVTKWIEIVKATPSYDRKAGALETLTKIQKEYGGDYIEYIKHALKERKQGVIDLLSNELEKTNTPGMTLQKDGNGKTLYAFSDNGN